MTLNEYHAEWKKDAQIAVDDLSQQACDVPLLHAKWWRFYSEERLKRRKLDLDYKLMYHNKTQWFNGKMIDDDRVKLGWPVNPLRLRGTEIDRYIDADSEVQALKKQEILQEEILKFLEDVIAQINKRGFHISNAINFLKFKNGVDR